MSDPVCTHTPDHRIWTLSNGTKQIVLQCTTCGETVSSAIARAKFTPEQIASFPPLDKVFQEKMRQEKIAAQVKAAQERSLVYALDRIRHTQKYHDYLLTPKWQAKRIAVLKRDGFICRGCLTAEATQAHHLTYDHVFDELLFELIAVCVPCHERAHQVRDRNAP
jgi:hypothetical protein